MSGKQAKTNAQKEFECWASHQPELQGRSAKWYLDGYDDPFMRVAFKAYIAPAKTEAKGVLSEHCIEQKG